MRPSEFTDEAIIQAGKELIDANRNVTGFALRQKVGGGFPARLKQVWDEHVASRSTATQAPLTELPIEVSELVANVGKDLMERIGALSHELNHKAVTAADRRVHDVLRTAAEQRTQTESELADASQTLQDLEEQLDAARSQAAASDSDMSILRNANQGLAVELAQVRERLAAAEHAAQQTKALHDEERERHAGELDQARQATIDERARADAAEKLQRLAQSQVSELESRQTIAEHDARQLAQRFVDAELQRDEAKAQAAAAREETAHVRGQLEATARQAEELLQKLGQAPLSDAAPSSASGTKDAGKPTVKRSRRGSAGQLEKGG